MKSSLTRLCFWGCVVLCIFQALLVWHTEARGLTEEEGLGVSNYAVGTYKQENSDVLWAYPLNVCAHRGLTMSNNEHVRYTCIDGGSRLKLEVFKSGVCKDYKLQSSKVYENDEADFNCFGEDNWFDYLLYNGGCADDISHTAVATNVCLPYGGSQFSFSTCDTVNGGIITLATNNACNDPYDTIEAPVDCTYQTTFSGYDIYSQIKRCIVDGLDDFVIEAGIEENATDCSYALDWTGPETVDYSQKQVFNLPVAADICLPTADGSADIFVTECTLDPNSAWLYHITGSCPPQSVDSSNGVEDFYDESFVEGRNKDTVHCGMDADICSEEEDYSELRVFTSFADCSDLQTEEAFDTVYIVTNKCLKLSTGTSMIAICDNSNLKSGVVACFYDNVDCGGDAVAHEFEFSQCMDDTPDAQGVVAYDLLTCVGIVAVTSTSTMAPTNTMSSTTSIASTGASTKAEYSTTTTEKPVCCNGGGGGKKKDRTVGIVVGVCVPLVALMFVFAGGYKMRQRRLRIAQSSETAITSMSHNNETEMHTR